MLLFGGIYMGVRGLWRPLGVMMLIAIGTSFFFWPLLILVAPGLWILAAARAQHIFADHYTRLGWDEIDPWQQTDEEGA
jgi:hypothetical protein